MIIFCISTSPPFCNTSSNSSDDNFFISSINVCSSLCKFKLIDSLSLTPFPLFLDIISGSTLNPLFLIYSITSSNSELLPNISLKIFDNSIAFFLALDK